MSDSTPSSLNADAIKKIAKLARLEVQENEVDGLCQDLSNILQYIDKLSELDTSEVEPLSHVHGEHSKYRDDTVHEYENREAILEGVPERSGNFIKVPLIIDQESH